MTYIDNMIKLAEREPGRTMMFIQYDVEEHAYDRAEWCRDSYPDYQFTVGRYNNTWAVAVTVPLRAE